MQHLTWNVLFTLKLFKLHHFLIIKIIRHQTLCTMISSPRICIHVPLTYPALPNPVPSLLFFHFATLLYTGRYVTSNFSRLKPIFHCDAKLLALGPLVGLDPQRQNFALGILTCRYQKTLKFALPLTRTPNASQWNIGYVGSPGVGARVGHVHFMLFIFCSLALGTQCEPSFQCNTGLSVTLEMPKVDCITLQISGS